MKIIILFLMGFLPLLALDNFPSYYDLRKEYSKDIILDENIVCFDKNIGYFELIKGTKINEFKAEISCMSEKQYNEFGYSVSLQVKSFENVLYTSMLYIFIFFLSLNFLTLFMKLFFIFLKSANPVKSKHYKEDNT